MKVCLVGALLLASASGFDFQKKQYVPPAVSSASHQYLFPLTLLDIDSITP